MTNSTWKFGCNLGLAQDTCGKYKRDKNSRGSSRYSGCPSCTHRKPEGAATVRAEAEHAASE